ncbi:MAG: DNA polymerase IV [Candidatus Pristimantibacillus lignocellulolyticus]|uniref:DNA polymerase IV n=1 Tax=Candidatus Pristimantibacillus lignocellulolyticus TaxID=2994561 RepID=A0A9J6ZFI6_9BACL|nr:MAG: DNA polymerase IV [Candidatus Pristimantibacillus lignocellulolyticus]
MQEGLKSVRKQRVIMLADCQSFYASVEKMAHPEYVDRPLVVAGDPERRSGIILAACPLAKSFGITTAENLGTALAKCPDLIVIRPRMEEYIKVSMQITEIYLSYTDLVEPYSIDEQFLDVTGSLAHYQCNADELAHLIQHQVELATGIYTRYGISTNKILAKTACDNFAKKNESGMYTLLREDLEHTLWKLPIEKMFMVGRRMNVHLQSMGIYTIGELANTPLDKLKQRMRRKFGKNSDINAELYWRIANGIDDSPVAPGTYENTPKSIGNMTTLPRDYSKLEEIKIILLELSEVVCQRARSQGLMAHVVTVTCRGANFDFPTGFNRQSKMDDPTNVTNHVYHAAVELFIHHWDSQPVRQVGVSLSKLTSDDEYQISLFDNGREKSMALEKVTDAIKQKYGETTITRAVSITNAGQAIRRAEMIGGHHK